METKSIYSFQDDLKCKEKYIENNTVPSISDKATCIKLSAIKIHIKTCKKALLTSLLFSVKILHACHFNFFFSKYFVTKHGDKILV